MKPFTYASISDVRLPRLSSHYISLCYRSSARQHRSLWALYCPEAKSQQRRVNSFRAFDSFTCHCVTMPDAGGVRLFCSLPLACFLFRSYLFLAPLCAYLPPVPLQLLECRQKTNVIRVSPFPGQVRSVRCQGELVCKSFRYSPWCEQTLTRVKLAQAL